MPPNLHHGRANARCAIRAAFLPISPSAATAGSSPLRNAGEKGLALRTLRVRNGVRSSNVVLARERLRKHMRGLDLAGVAAAIFACCNPLQVVHADTTLLNASYEPT